MMNEPVSSIMTTDLQTVEPEDRVIKVLEIFKGKKIHHMPVMERGILVGLITTSDLLWMNRPFEEYENVLVKDVMTTRLAKLEPTAKIGTAAEMFLRNWFHAVPIVDESGMLVGIVTTFDVLKYNFNKEYPHSIF